MNDIQTMKRIGQVKAQLDIAFRLDWDRQPALSNLEVMQLATELVAAEIVAEGAVEAAKIIIAGLPAALGHDTDNLIVGMGRALREGRLTSTSATNVPRELNIKEPGG